MRRSALRTLLTIILLLIVLVGYDRLPSHRPGTLPINAPAGEELRRQDTAEQPDVGDLPSEEGLQPPQSGDEPEPRTVSVSSPTDSAPPPRSPANATPSPGASTRSAPPAAQTDEPAVTLYRSFVDENIRLINQERAKQGLPALQAHNDLMEVAAWAASGHVRNQFDISSTALKNKINSYPALAVLSFTINLSTSTADNSQRFIDIFAVNRNNDITGSAGLRKNILNKDMSIIGAAMAGAHVIEDGRERYKLTFVWIVMPSPPPPGIVGHDGIAQQNILLLNRERNQRGLNPLGNHPELMVLAYRKARDMIENDYFAHESKNLGTPHEMIIAAVQPRPRMTAENLWKVEGSYRANFFDGAAQRAHDGLMNSEGHRRNMMHEDFTHVGVAAVSGVVRRPGGSVYKLVLVQLFIREGS